MRTQDADRFLSHVPVPMKRCRECGEEKMLGHFYKDKKKETYGSYCKPCHLS
jgi:hypothetical protein